MKRIFFLATLVAGTLSLSAQHNMQVWQGSGYNDYSTTEVDSITFLDAPEGTLIVCKTDIDTVFVSKTDTMFVTKRDTIIQTDTITRKDTVYIKTPSSKGIGRYAVAANRYVSFAKGNLQYHAATNRWRLAEHQYDVIGDKNTNISDTYNGWIDMFGWGTRMYPTLTATESEKYLTFVDWGTNYIGTDEPDTWRTLTIDEWTYLFQNNRWTLGRVNGSLGVMLLPQNLDLPDGTTVYIIGNGQLTGNWHSFAQEDYANNTYTTAQFALMEQQGVVFLPIGGWRRGTSVYTVGSETCYWSSTGEIVNLNQYAAYVYIREASIKIVPEDSRYYGYLVRLVKAN